MKQIKLLEYMLAHEELMKHNEYYIDLQTNNYSSSHKKMDGDIIVDENISEQK